MYRCCSWPARIAAMPRVTLRVTNVPPRRGRLVVEQDPVAGVQALRVAVLDGHPVGEHLGDRVRAARVERACSRTVGGGVLPNISLDPAW